MEKNRNQEQKHFIGTKIETGTLNHPSEYLYHQCNAMQCNILETTGNNKQFVFKLLFTHNPCPTN